MHTVSSRSTVALLCCTARHCESYGNELGKLHASIDSVQSGRFLKALVREEVRQDKDWVIRLRSLPESPETYYLTELSASHDFQTALQNYLDLDDLRVRLDTWQRSFAAYEDLIERRRAYYEPLLPGLDQQFRELDSRRRIRLEQHKILDGSHAEHARCAASGSARDQRRTSARRGA